MRRILLSAVCALFLVTGSANAAPVPPGGFSLIEVTSLASLTNITLNAEAPAQMSSLFGDVFFRFPVIDVTGNITSIGHAGGILLQRMATMLSLSDFVINVAQNRILAEVNNAGGSVFPLFNMVQCSTIGNCPVTGGTAVLTGIGLNLTPEARTAINNAFSGLNLPANFQFGILKEVTIVPEPTTGLLVLAGLFAVGARARRRAA
ncbi:MAG TPA: PEP-CTERM sorting domain-containing protein [Myxococcota bacterium]|nr:PEP-CTERM sorting domain-containing protein [Myxococcota bacterium]